MQSTWNAIVRRLDSYPSRIHRLLPPCSEERLREVQSKLGKLPKGVIEMLRQFNGAELFMKHGPMITVFGISTLPALPPLEWAEDWYIDIFTPWWRAFGERQPPQRPVGEDRQNDWAVAMMNYGGLIIVGGDGRVREWDTAQRMWDPRSFNDFEEWVEDILREGDAFLKEE